MPSDGFEQVLRVNLFGSFLLCKHAVAHMQARNCGRVLLIASIAGKEGNAGMSGCSSAKAGVIGLVKSAGKEFAETDITIDALARICCDGHITRASNRDQRSGIDR